VISNVGEFLPVDFNGFMLSPRAVIEFLGYTTIVLAPNSIALSLRLVPPAPWVKLNRAGWHCST
jgi:hypothetical protein